jgi:hypothetical protein
MYLTHHEAVWPFSIGLVANSHEVTGVYINAPKTPVSPVLMLFNADVFVL